MKVLSDSIKTELRKRTLEITPLVTITLSNPLRSILRFSNKYHIRGTNQFYPGLLFDSMSVAQSFETSRLIYTSDYTIRLASNLLNGGELLDKIEPHNFINAKIKIEHLINGVESDIVYEGDIKTITPQDTSVSLSCGVRRLGDYDSIPKEKITRTKYPTAPQSSIGKVIPIVFGNMNIATNDDDSENFRAKAIRIDQAANRFIASGRASDYGDPDVVDEALQGYTVESDVFGNGTFNISSVSRLTRTSEKTNWDVIPARDIDFTIEDDDSYSLEDTFNNSSEKISTYGRVESNASTVGDNPIIIRSLNPTATGMFDPNFQRLAVSFRLSINNSMGLWTDNDRTSSDYAVVDWIYSLRLSDSNSNSIYLQDIIPGMTFSFIKNARNKTDSGFNRFVTRRYSQYGNILNYYYGLNPSQFTQTQWDILANCSSANVGLGYKHEGSIEAASQIDVTIDGDVTVSFNNFKVFVENLTVTERTEVADLNQVTAVQSIVGYEDSKTNYADGGVVKRRGDVLRNTHDVIEAMLRDKEYGLSIKEGDIIRTPNTSRCNIDWQCELIDESVMSGLLRYSNSFLIVNEQHKWEFSQLVTSPAAIISDRINVKSFSRIRTNVDRVGNEWFVRYAENPSIVDESKNRRTSLASGFVNAQGTGTITNNVLTDANAEFDVSVAYASEYMKVYAGGGYWQVSAITSATQLSLTPISRAANMAGVKYYVGVGFDYRCYLSRERYDERFFIKRLETLYPFTRDKACVEAALNGDIELYAEPQEGFVAECILDEVTASLQMGDCVSLHRMIDEGAPAGTLSHDTPIDGNSIRLTSGVAIKKNQRAIIISTTNEGEKVLAGSTSSGVIAITRGYSRPIVLPKGSVLHLLTDSYNVMSVNKNLPQNNVGLTLVKR